VSAGRGRWRRAALSLAGLALLSACGAGDGPEQTIAILRAVPTMEDGADQIILDELRAAGHVAGRNLAVLAEAHDESYPDPDDAERVVASWAEEGLDLVVAFSSSGAAAAHRSAPNVNILFISIDPVAAGLVEDERQPEGRLTGVTFRVPADRTLALARRVLPELETVGLAYPPADPAAVAHRDAVADAVDAAGMRLLLEEFNDGTDVGPAVDRLVRRGSHALLLSTSPTGVRAVAETGAAVAPHRIPVIANTNLADFALVALYPDSEEIGRQLGRQAARLLSGSSPAAVPVEDPRRFLIRLDAGVARQLGVELSDEVLREANEVVAP
jgi:putative tryptophan/tyrosine transport system substrate-binding protein